MTTAALIPSHVHLDPEGRAWIDDTNTKVIEVVIAQIAYGWSPDEIHRQFPHLSMAQVHGALMYYFDHQASFDAEIERQVRENDRALADEQDSPLRQRLRAAGHLP